METFKLFCFLRKIKGRTWPDMIYLPFAVIVPTHAIFKLVLYMAAKLWHCAAYIPIAAFTFAAIAVLESLSDAVRNLLA
jgi:hypothetical protein